MTAAFPIETIRASVGDVHARAMPDPAVRAVWFVEPSDSAVVLGSTQGIAALDLAAVSERGLAVVRRRSGGGAVVVEPNAQTWLDVVLPAGDPLWRDDVVESAVWVGDVLAEALRSLGIDADDPIRASRPTTWSPLVCFAGIGAGEVRVDGRKVVGISQRRTRSAARFQVTVLHRFDASATAALFNLDAGARIDLERTLSDEVGSVDVGSAALRSAIEVALVTR